VAPNASGVSAAPSVPEGTYAEPWGRNIWADTLAIAIAVPSQASGSLHTDSLTFALGSGAK